MDPQSWTPQSDDYVRIVRMTRDPQGGAAYEQVGPFLFKRRLQRYPVTTVEAQAILVEFRTNGRREAWGFRLYVTPHLCGVSPGGEQGGFPEPS